MANRTVQIDILADEKNFVRGTGNAGQSATKLSQVLAKLGPVGQLLQSALEKIGLGSISAGAGITGGITAALGTSVALVEKAINSYLAITDSIRSYSLVTGQSAEASSRQVAAFRELGVSEDVAQSAMFKLGKAADETPAKLEKLGIAVTKDANGNLDLNATLLNVMRAYQGTTDAGQRATIMFTAFGKGGQAMVPILEAGVAELTKLEAQVGKVYTQADLDNARRYQVSQKQLGQSWTDLVSTIGSDLVPALADTFQNTNANIYAQTQLTKAYQAGKITYDQFTFSNQDLLEGYRKDYLAAQNAKAGIDALANAQQAAANAAKAEADAEDVLYTALEKNTSAEFAYEQSLIDLKNAQDVVAAGTGNATENNLRLREAYVKVADAAVAQAEAQAAANGTTVTAAQKADLYRQTLENLMGQLGPNDPLRQNLQGYIDELNSIPSAKSTSVGFTTQPYVGHGGPQAFAGGGVVEGSSSEHPVLARRGEGVFTPEQMAALPSVGASQGKAEIHIHVTGLISDGPTIDLLANAVALRLGYATGR